MLATHRKVTEASVHKVDQKPNDKECNRCGGRHSPDSCSFKEKECFYCHNKGHAARKCGKKVKASGSAKSSSQHKLECGVDKEDDDEIFNNLFAPS